MNVIYFLTGRAPEARKRYADAERVWKLAARADAAGLTGLGDAFHEQAVMYYRDVWRLEVGSRRAAKTAQRLSEPDVTA